MLDQNTDRMWFVIGAVIVGAAIIFIANGTLPDLFASVTDTFEGALWNAEDVIEEIGEADANLFKSHYLSSRGKRHHLNMHGLSVDLKVKPNTQYTASTDAPYEPALKGASYYVFFDVPDVIASTRINHVSEGKPRTITSGEDGIIRVTVRDHKSFFDDPMIIKDEILAGNYHIWVVEGTLPYDRMVK